jgi:hypothetical protein
MMRGYKERSCASGTSESKKLEHVEGKAKRVILENEKGAWFKR